MSKKKDVRIFSDEAKTLDRPVVEITVGSEKKESFCVHKNLICERSAFFANALKPEWVKANGKKIELQDDDPEIFSLYLQLLYTDKLPVKGRETPKSSDNLKKSSDREHDDFWRSKDAECIQICQLYILADKLQDVTSKNTVVDAIIELLQEIEVLEDADLGPFLDFDVINRVYDGTPESSPLRRLMTDHWIHHANTF
ncbi:hypothetical protein K491DRAFT_774638 [Lophiostoma macrostomum CBS 122681]|uniref:BTB domain-containing protein n=1 Tax=Lophiostoma macrostomum CBS 122681 TaxID=1314788 RepID=A0A6A6TN47_9PLEO|nr:hypothetical protein K491DRAFT_774638 [Lophiostoma macrostomum CBS 122681]